MGGALSSDSSAHLSVPRAISTILATWLGHYPEDFFQPPEFRCLKTLLAYIGLNMPGSDLEQRAWLLLSRLRHLGPAEPEAGGEEDWGWLTEACGGETVGHTEQASTDCRVAGSKEWSQITVPTGHSLGRPPRDGFSDSDNTEWWAKLLHLEGTWKDNPDDRTFSSWSHSSSSSSSLRARSGTAPPKARPSSHCGACCSFRA